MLLAHPGVINLFQALLTPLVALLALGIAFAQWWTARNRLKLDLFDRRWAIYDATRTALTEIYEHEQLSKDKLWALREAIRTANWLLDEDLDRHLRESLWPHVVLLGTPMDADDQRRQLRKGRRDWVIVELAVIHSKFDRFLKMDENISDWLLGLLPRRLKGSPIERAAYPDISR
jgi:hypothetical protein